MYYEILSPNPQPGNPAAPVAGFDPSLPAPGQPMTLLGELIAIGLYCAADEAAKQTDGDREATWDAARWQAQRKLEMGANP